MPTGWSVSAGTGGTIDVSTQKFGSRSIKVQSPPGSFSGVHQIPGAGLTYLENGMIYEVSGWIKMTAEPANATALGGMIKIETVDGITGYTVIEKVIYGADPSPNLPYTGLAFDGLAHEWTFVRCRFAPIGSGRVYVILYSGQAANNATVWFDGVKLARMWQWNSPDLRDSIITTAKLVDAAVSDVKIATAAITTTKIADDSVTTPKLVALNVTAAKIAALAVTADKINVATLSAITANVGTVNAGIINCSSLIIRTGGINPRVELDSTGFHSYDAGGVEYYKVSPMTIGTKVYGYEWRMHPNVPAGSSMVVAGHTNKASNILLQTADGTELGNRAAIYMVHAGSIEFHTQHTKRMEVTGFGPRLFAASDPSPPSDGIYLYNVSNAYLSWYAAANPVSMGTAWPADCIIAVRVNGTIYGLLAHKF
jgi:hypothetical protein